VSTEYVSRPKFVCFVLWGDVKNLFSKIAVCVKTHCNDAKSACLTKYMAYNKEYMAYKLRNLKVVCSVNCLGGTNSYNEIRKPGQTFDLIYIFSSV
jgi:hypothetical protein